MTERLLVVGGTGMLGHRIVLEATQQVETWWTARGDGSEARDLLPMDRCLARVDITELGRVRALLDSIRPTVVVNCAGTVKQRTRVSAAEMIRTNALFPHELTDACDAVGARLVHVSTDCVYSGSEGDRPFGYDEGATPDAGDLYGRSKLLGEIDRPGHLTVRTSTIGPELSHRSGLLEWFLGTTPPIAGYRRARFTGLTTSVLSRLLLGLALDYRAVSGLYHLAGPAIDKYSLLTALRDRLRPGVAIDCDDSVCVDRRLDGRRLAAVAAIDVPSWDEMIDELASFVRSGKGAE